MSTAPPLPRPLRRGLARIDRKIRGLAIARGLGLVAIPMAVIAALGMALDFFVPLPIAARWGIWGAWVAVGALVLLRSVLYPLVKRADDAELAAVAERDRPDLGERLTSTVELLGTARTPHGSPALIAALAEEASRRAESSDLGSGIPARRAARTFALGAVMAALAIAPAFARPDPFAALARRFLMPWADVDRVGRFLVSVEPGDSVVAIGSDVPITATIRPRFGPMPRVETAFLEWDGADGARGRARMTADDSATPAFRITLPRLAASVRYRVTTDSAEGSTHRITAVEPPSVAKIEARVAPPAYTKLSASTAKNPARIEAWEGSRIAVALTPNKPIASARLVWPAPPDARESSDPARGLAMTTADGGKTWTADATADVSGNYAFVLEDEHAIRNRPEPPRRLVVRPDAPPTITLGGSPDPKDAQRDDLLVVELLARDDLAVTACDLIYAIEPSASSGGAGPEEGRIAARVTGLGTRSARGEASLNLKNLALKTGDVLTYRIRVEDSRPAPRGPNVTLSPPRVLRIVDKAEPLLARERSIERQSLQDQLNELRRLAAENRQEAQTLRYAADAAGRGNGKWDDAKQADLARREASARSVVEKLQSLANDFAESGRYAPLERPARQIAGLEAEAGRSTLDAARRAPDANRRLADLRDADDRLASVQGRLDELQAKFDDLNRLDDDRRKLRELAERQDELARKAEELAQGGDRDAIERARQEQEALRAQVDELARRSPELRAEALAARAKDADDLAKRTRDLANRQREEARKTADPTGRAARLRELAEMQRELEEDARRLAMKVDRPLEENGRARLDAGALNRPIEPLERGEMDAGRQRLDEAEGTLRRLARDLDEVRDDPKALARRLARRQDALNNQVAEAIRDARDPEQKAALPQKLKPLAERQEAIARLAAAIPVPDELKDPAREAKESAERSARDLKENKNDQVQNHQNETRDRLNRLADALPDANALRQRAMQAMAEAKGRTDQVSRELDEHLRATAKRPDQQDFDPDAAARDLARRVAPLADRMAEAARHLAEVSADRDSADQRDRALDRVRDLADTLDTLREAAPPESKSADAKPPSGWRILGAFDDARRLPPFPIDRTIDLKAPYDGRKKTHPTWKPVEPDGNGRIDLGAMFSRDDNQSAFGYVEIASPAEGRGRLFIGSDDTLVIWLNGKRVYGFEGSRAWGAGQDRVEVTFAQGVNRMIVRCGNGNGEWAFSVTAQTPRTPDLARRADAFQRLRDRIPAEKLDATAALERLEQALQGRETADARAAEIAAGMKPGPEGGEAPAEPMRRMAAALRDLKIPDALPQKAEAVRAAERAARAEAEHRPDAARARAQAAKAAEALARRLADADAPAEQAEALAAAEAGLGEADAASDPRARAEVQKAIADQAAAIEAETPKAPAARDATRRAADLAQRAADNPDAAPPADRQEAARQEAANALAELAREAGKARPRVADAGPAGASPREAARALAARERQIAQKAEALKARAEKAPRGDEAAQKQVTDELAGLADQQEAIAEATRALADPLPSGGAPRREAEQAREAARSAASRAEGALEANDPARAAASAKGAADALDALAQKLPEKAPAPADPPKDPELTLSENHAREARDLARRERDIRERMHGMLADRAEAQDALRHEAQDLGRRMAALRDATRDVSARSHGPANNAAEILRNQAPPAMNEGAQHLVSGRPDPARDAQRRAAESLERAADQAQDLAAAIRADAPADAMARAEEAAGQGEGRHEGDARGEPPPGDLASARAAQKAASQELAAGRDAPESAGRSARAASQAMRQAAQGMRAAAASPGGRPASSLASRDGKERGRPHEGDNREPKEGETGPGDASLAQLQEAIRARTGRNWGELPGHLRSEILQMSKGKYRDDYARLIGLYFREIAAGRDDDQPGAKP